MQSVNNFGLGESVESVNNCGQGESVQSVNNFGVSGQTSWATVLVPGDEPQPAQLQPSLTHFLLIIIYII